MTGGEKIKTPNNLNNLNTHLEKDKSEEQNGAERSRTAQNGAERSSVQEIHWKRNANSQYERTAGSEISENRVRID